MRIVRQDTNSLVSEVNSIIDTNLVDALLSHGDVVAETVGKGPVEFIRADGNYIQLIIFETTAPFEKVMTVNQLDRLHDDVFAIADAESEAMLVASTESWRIKRTPLLKKVVEQNAAGLINSLGEGVWVFRVDKRTHLHLLNPLPGVNGKPAELFQVNNFIHIEQGFTPRKPEGGMYFSRPEHAPFAITLHDK